MMDTSVFLHTIPFLPFLTDFTGQVVLETLDKWNNIVKLVLPYIVMSFKVCTFISSISPCSHILQCLLFFSQTIISFSHFRMNGANAISSQ